MTVPAASSVRAMTLVAAEEGSGLEGELFGHRDLPQELPVGAEGVDDAPLRPAVGLAVELDSSSAGDGGQAGEGAARDADPCRGEAEGVDSTAAPRHDVTALHEAAFMGHVDVVRHLLERGADPGRRETLYRSTALGWAAKGRRKEVIDAILEVHEPDLFDAVELDLVDHVRRHLDRDPSLVDAPEGLGDLLRWAARQDRRELVALLLRRGADTTLADEQGATALDLARQHGNDEVARILAGRTG